MKEARSIMGLEGLPIVHEIGPAFDSLYADLSVTRFLVTITIHVKANVLVWNESKEVRESVRDTKRSFDDYIRNKTGLQSELQLPGNYAREILAEGNGNLLPDFLDGRHAFNKRCLREIIRQFRWLRMVYRAKIPNKDDVASYKQKAVQLGRQLIQVFPWASWPNYLHRIFEHVQQIIEEKGSVGSLSAEGSEANNKQTRLFRTLRSCTFSADSSMEDVLELGWLVTSKPLQTLAETSKRQYLCSNCGDEGHSKRSCPRNINDNTDD